MEKDGFLKIIYKQHAKIGNSGDSRNKLKIRYGLRNIGLFTIELYNDHGKCLLPAIRYVNSQSMQ